MSPPIRSLPAVLAVLALHVATPAQDSPLRWERKDGESVALLRGEQAVFEQSLADADDWLRDYFDTNSAQVRGARATLEEIRSSMVVVSPPDISASLQLLRQYNNLSGAAQ